MRLLSSPRSTSADAEAIENIEKLQGQKIERIGELPAAEPEEAKKPRGRKAKPDQDSPPVAEAPREEARAPRPRDDRPREDRPRARRDDRPRRDQRYEARDTGPDAQDDGGWNGPIPDFLNFTIPA